MSQKFLLRCLGVLGHGQSALLQRLRQDAAQRGRRRAPELAPILRDADVRDDPENAVPHDQQPAEVVAANLNEPVEQNVALLDVGYAPHVLRHGIHDLQQGLLGQQRGGLEDRVEDRAQIGVEALARLRLLHRPLQGGEGPEGDPPAPGAQKAAVAVAEVHQGLDAEHVLGCETSARAGTTRPAIIQLGLIARAGGRVLGELVHASLPGLVQGQPAATEQQGLQAGQCPCQVRLVVAEVEQKREGAQERGPALRDHALAALLPGRQRSLQRHAAAHLKMAT
mmetsp:Transcript_26657/g.75011  ORF Transcript_26657/g.75011 Transcript_26657/m.75011 type:complete len:281 (+) Transcript_26657:1151-1993(+)